MMMMMIMMSFDSWLKNILGQNLALEMDGKAGWIIMMLMIKWTLTILMGSSE